VEEEPIVTVFLCVFIGCPAILFWLIALAVGLNPVRSAAIGALLGIGGMVTTVIIVVGSAPHASAPAGPFGANDTLVQPSPQTLNPFAREATEPRPSPGYATRVLEPPERVLLAVTVPPALPNFG
jgi:hypothetical protein